ncbi:MAG: hypothetical protein FOGNACKC_05628 [Anaerolineae bacterium]|nr:hypothetical protein [Anaerolineae bacterium]
MWSIILPTTFSMVKKMDKSRFLQLINALNGGWEIEEPVLLGAMWRSPSFSDGTYHFVLRNRREDKTTLMSLPPSPQLLMFLSENKINVSTMQS